MPAKQIFSLIKNHITARQKHQKILLEMALEWALIVGEVHARSSFPTKIIFPHTNKKDRGILHIAVTHAHAPFLEYDHYGLVSNINAWFGYEAVGTIKLHQTTE